MNDACRFVRSMGLGWNLGNTFDAFSLHNEATQARETGASWRPEDQQRLWGNQPFTARQARRVADAGFGTIRIPVTWAEWMSPDGDVDPVWMQSVMDAVEASLAVGLKVILNVHHDGGEGDVPWIRTISQHEEMVLHRYQRLWEQIGARCVDYDERLVLEGANELDFHDVAMDDAYGLLGRINQTFVDTVRAAGGQNGTRFLLIPGYNTDTTKTCVPGYVLPQDSVDHRLLLSVHYYSPAEFSVAEHDSPWCKPSLTWGSEVEVAAMHADFERLRTTYVERGVPVVIGEYGVLTQPVDHKDHKSNVYWLTMVVKNALDIGACPVLWDTSTKEMRFLDRESGPFYDPEVERVYRDAASRLSNDERFAQYETDAVVHVAKNLI